MSEALRLLRSGNPAIVLGSLGYWAFDNLVLWACFHAFGVEPALAVVLMGYLIGQLGGLPRSPAAWAASRAASWGRSWSTASRCATPSPPCSPTASSSWIPLLLALPAFASLQRGLNRPERPDLCVPPISA